ncbi:DUF3426 domain-containing protein [Methylotenera oryzisoli]|uniref:DUF3426 domain-containing protein n=1 Tax=Methylotenera oryzisoli TaxID=2080758 RepID=A0A4Y9VU35_9PROT|nr:DUF3426 domain-containing protein [Methylotenera oryzisoli]TFW72231.1 DUF3426 domain-containing protein [Methylotenera oryzisoli]
MRDITHCPNCQTQFFVSEDQLKQHGGLVRCGQCLHVFNAKEQFVPTSTPTPENTASVAPNATEAATDTSANRNAPSTWPAIDLSFEEATPATNSLEANPEPAAPTVAQSSVTSADTASASEQPTATITHTGALAELPHDPSSIAEHPPNDTAILNLSHHHPNDFNELAKHAKRDGKKTTSRRWLWALGTFVFLLSAVAQSAYFLRNTIAIYYPNLKPQLVQACQHLKCSIELPKQIEWIVIDDSDMQEDLEHTGVMHLSSSLLNKASFVQAYPNLELTLTNTDDSAVLRRVFKPAEYLPPHTDIAAGFSAGNEIKVKLAITTQDVNVAGYRIYVTY